jgi:hypothetical protein
MNAHERDLLNNTNKTFSMFIKGEQRKSEGVTVTVSGCPLSCVEVFKYLGFHFNSSLSLPPSMDCQSLNASASFAILQLCQSTTMLPSDSR